MELIKSEPEDNGSLRYSGTCIQDAAVQQASGQEGLVFAGADLCAHQLGAGR